MTDLLRQLCTTRRFVSGSSLALAASPGPDRSFCAFSNSRPRGGGVDELWITCISEPGHAMQDSWQLHRPLWCHPSMAAGAAGCSTTSICWQVCRRAGLQVTLRCTSPECVSCELDGSVIALSNRQLCHARDMRKGRIGGVCGLTESPGQS